MRIDDQQSQRWPPSEVRAKRENIAHLTRRLSEQGEQSSEVKREGEGNGVYCQRCEEPLTKGSFFKCHSCEEHLLCSKCFWRYGQENL